LLLLLGVLQGWVGEGREEGGCCRTSCVRVCGYYT